MIVECTEASNVCAMAADQLIGKPLPKQGLFDHHIPGDAWQAGHLTASWKTYTVARGMLEQHV